MALMPQRLRKEMSDTQSKMSDTQSKMSSSLRDILDSVVDCANLPFEQARVLPPLAYTDPDFYDWEVENILKKQWLCVGHTSQVAKVGDYLNVTILKEPLIVVRDSNADIRVLSRVCVHRGMDIMPAAYGHPTQGNRRSFLCPYHHWSYSLDGKLLGAPEMQQRSNFDPNSCGLPELRSEVWEGFIYVTFNPRIEPVHKVYAGLLPYVDRWQMGDMEMVASVSWDCDYNWKILVENFMEPYHHLGAHHKTFEPIMPAAGTWTEAESPSHVACHLPFSEAILRSPEKLESLIPFECGPKLEANDFKEYAVFLGEPNFLLFVGPDRVYWYFLLPDGPGHMTLHTTLLLKPESKAKEDYSQKLNEAVQQLKEFHLEDMEVCTAIQTGLQSQSYRSGPLGPLEMPIWLFQRCLARKIKEASKPSLSSEFSMAR